MGRIKDLEDALKRSVKVNADLNRITLRQRRIIRHMASELGKFRRKVPGDIIEEYEAKEKKG